MDHVVRKKERDTGRKMLRLGSVAQATVLARVANGQLALCNLGSCMLHERHQVRMFVQHMATHILWLDTPVMALRAMISMLSKSCCQPRPTTRLFDQERRGTSAHFLLVAHTYPAHPYTLDSCSC